MALEKRETLVHQMNNKRSVRPQGSIFKIEGTEFLPEGFIELDPLLIIDEYEFKNDEEKDLFKKEQEKVKALRRKQYMQKDYKKKRDVIIYLLNERINKLHAHLTDFYLNAKRPLTPSEKLVVANTFSCDVDTLNDLEELFLY